MHRFFVTTSVEPGAAFDLDGPQAHQITKVLRLEPGARIVVLDGQGWEYEVVLREVHAKQVRGEAVTRRAAGGEPRTRVTLFQSLLARDKVEWVLQKATEVGVAEIVPVVTERSLVRETRRFKPERRERWCRILIEAAEQSHRGRVPELSEPVTLAQALDRAETLDRALIACPHTDSPSLAERLSGLPEAPVLGLFIGPEGGFSPAEIQSAQTQGVLPIGLGRRILRTETAAIVAASLILYECGEFRPY
jgi:16S rRNA (uracil1498-N3)-methyltransferase